MFVFEVIFRIGIQRIYFFLGPEWRWNVFDLLVVTVSTFQDVTGVMPDWSKMFRTFRCFRVIRAVRGQRFLTSLRLMMGCLLHSLETLIWALVLLALIMYFFTVIFLQGASSFIRTSHEHGQILRSGADIMPLVKEHFGDFAVAFRSLFMAVTGGTDWYEMQATLAWVGDAYGVLFLFYVFFMMFVLFNILVGVFVDRAFEASKLDTDIAIQVEKDRLRAFMSEVYEMFEEIDTADRGVITLDQFLECQS